MSDQFRRGSGVQIIGGRWAGIVGLYVGASTVVGRYYVQPCAFDREERGIDPVVEVEGKSFIVPYDPAREIRRAAFLWDGKLEEGYPDPDLKAYERKAGEPPRSDMARALLALTTSPHTRWVLSIVDKMALCQADDALIDAKEAYYVMGEGDPDYATPALVDVVREEIGEIESAIAQREKWIEDPESHPESKLLLGVLSRDQIIHDWRGWIIREEARVASLREMLRKAGLA